MLGNILRLVMLAGTGAGMAAGFRAAMFKLAALFATALVLGLMVAAGIGYFGVAIYLTLAPQMGAVGSATVLGAGLLTIAAILALICRAMYLRRSPVKAASSLGAAGLSSGLGGSLGAAALASSMAAGSRLDVRGALARNAMTVLLAAFVAGMVTTSRRR